MAIRQLAYGTAADATDEYLQMSKTTSRECFSNFCQGIIHLYMRRYLRKPIANDVQLLFALHEQQHGLPGTLGSIDCMHWDWKNCPVAWRGQYHRGDHPGPITVLEAVASYDLWIWHAYYGTSGATNDIVVVNQSPIFNDLFEGKAPDSSFSVNGRQYKHGYYLTDGIYPKWATFVKAYRYLTEPERIAFTEHQELTRKDIERAFAILKSKWHIVNWVTSDDIEVDISQEERAQNVNEVKNKVKKKEFIEINQLKTMNPYYYHQSQNYYGFPHPSPVIPYNHGGWIYDPMLSTATQDCLVVLNPQPPVEYVDDVVILNDQQPLRYSYAPCLGVPNLGAEINTFWDPPLPIPYHPLEPNYLENPFYRIEQEGVLFWKKLSSTKVLQQLVPVVYRRRRSHGVYKRAWLHKKRRPKAKKKDPTFVLFVWKDMNMMMNSRRRWQDSNVDTAIMYIASRLGCCGKTFALCARLPHSRCNVL
ncbi:hypothetical protein OSB04_018097 [Centaurea solstitialis]|uniref:Uncharacterized protein n=1 Tax=Centaurea solstitialis TaxID=347529 RepID=A0AA38TM73_9ASTR|nr:hypothetical protein OSB04_018097 [Centaurea solstitialis]